MTSLSPLVAWLLVLGTAGVATFFAVQQFRVRATLPTNLTPDDATYFRNQFIRRLIGCALLLAIATMIAGAYVSGLEARAERFGDEMQAKADAGNREPTPEQQQFRRTYAAFWIAVLLLLFAVLMVAAIDLYAIRRYGARHLKQIRDDRRAMLESELANYRRERTRRNGSGGPGG